MDVFLVGDSEQLHELADLRELAAELGLTLRLERDPERALAELRRRTRAGASFCFRLSAAPARGAEVAQAAARRDS